MSLHPDALYDPDGFKEMLERLRTEQSGLGHVPEKYIKIAETAVAGLRGQTFNNLIAFSYQADATETMGARLDRLLQGVRDNVQVNITDSLVGENLIFQTAEGFWNGGTATAGAIRNVVSLGASIESLQGDYGVIESLYANAIYQRIENPPVFGMWDKFMAFIDSMLDPTMNYDTAYRMRMERESRLAARGDIEEYFGSDIAQITTMISADGSFIEHPGNIADPHINAIITKEVMANDVTPFWQEMGGEWRDASIMQKTAMVGGASAVALLAGTPLVNFGHGALKGVSSAVHDASYVVRQREKISSTRFGKFAQALDDAPLAHRAGRLVGKATALGGAIPLAGLGIAGVSNAIKWSAALDDRSLSPEDLAAVELLLAADTAAGFAGLLGGEATSTALLEAVRATYDTPEEFDRRIGNYVPETIGGLIVDAAYNDSAILTTRQADLNTISDILNATENRVKVTATTEQNGNRLWELPQIRAFAEKWLEWHKNGRDTSVLDAHPVMIRLREAYDSVSNGFGSFAEFASSKLTESYLVKSNDLRHSYMTQEQLLHDLASRGVAYQQLLGQSLEAGVSLSRFEQDVLFTMRDLANDIKRNQKVHNRRNVPAMISPDYFGSNKGFVAIPTEAQRAAHERIVGTSESSLYKKAMMRVQQETETLHSDIEDFSNAFFEVINSEEITVGQIRYAMSHNPVFSDWLDTNNKRGLLQSDISKRDDDTLFMSIGGQEGLLREYKLYINNEGQERFDSALSERSTKFTLSVEQIQSLKYGIDTFTASLESALLMPLDESIAAGNPHLLVLIRKANNVRKAVTAGGDIYSTVAEFSDSYHVYEANGSRVKPKIITAKAVCADIAAIGSLPSKEVSVADTLDCGPGGASAWMNTHGNITHQVTFQPPPRA